MTGVTYDVAGDAEVGLDVVVDAVELLAWDDALLIS